MLEFLGRPLVAISSQYVYMTETTVNGAIMEFSLVKIFANTSFRESSIFKIFARTNFFEPSFFKLFLGFITESEIWVAPKTSK